MSLRLYHFGNLSTPKAAIQSPCVYTVDLCLQSALPILPYVFGWIVVYCKPAVNSYCNMFDILEAKFACFKQVELDL